MLYHQHLKPWLLIYLLVTVILFVSTVGTLVIIIINDINGFSFTQIVFSTCPAYTNMKLNFSMVNALQVCFVMSCIAIVFSLGQFILVVWQFIAFTKWSKENNQSQTQPFEDFSRNKLLMLYVFNGLGFLVLIPIVGWFGTLFIELSTCTGSQNQSQTYTLPLAIAVSGLIFQIFSFCLLLKLCYHFYQDQKEKGQEVNQNGKVKQKAIQDPFQTRQARRMSERKELEEIKKRILHSKAQQNKLRDDFGDQLYKSNSTIGSPNTRKDTLLNKNFPENDIFSNDNDRKQLRRKNKRKKMDFSNQNPNEMDITGNSQNGNPSNQNYPYGEHSDGRNLLLSPNEVSEKQRKLMKKLPKNGFKKNKRYSNGPNDVIFEDPDQDDLNSLNNQESNRRIKPAERYVSEEQQHKAELQIRKLRNLIDNLLPKTPKSEDFYIFKTKYNHMIHLLKEQKKNVTPSERRCIKRPLLAVKSKIVQFDSKNYDIEEFVIRYDNDDQNPNDKYNSNNSQKPIGSASKLQNEAKNSINAQANQNQPTEQIIFQIAPQTLLKAKALRSAAYHWQRGFTEGKKNQYYNPIKNYVEQGQQYQDRLNKIMQFQQIGIRKRTDDYDPFEKLPDKEKIGQIKEKLYLHKNKPKIGRAHQVDDPMEEYGDRSDPFRDMVFDDDFQMQRNVLVRDDTNENPGKSQKKGFIDGILNTVNTPQPRRINRKEGGLVELIRGKQPVSFL